VSLTGTSMAAPVVAGTVALMLDANPHLTPLAVKGILQLTAERRVGYDALTQGAGFLDAFEAVTYAAALARPGRQDAQEARTSPARDALASKDACGGDWCVDVLGGAADGGNIVWGTGDGENIVWGTAAGEGNIVWGTSEGENIVWGTDQRGSVVWDAADRVDAFEVP